MRVAGTSEECEQSSLYEYEIWPMDCMTYHGVGKMFSGIHTHTK